MESKRLGDEVLSNQEACHQGWRDAACITEMAISFTHDGEPQLMRLLNHRSENLPPENRFRTCTKGVCISSGTSVRILRGADDGRIWMHLSHTGKALSFNLVTFIVDTTFYGATNLRIEHLNVHLELFAPHIQQGNPTNWNGTGDSRRFHIGSKGLPLHAILRDDGQSVGLTVHLSREFLVGRGIGALIEASHLKSLEADDIISYEDVRSIPRASAYDFIVLMETIEEMLQELRW
jgi:hypothetical protein